MNLDMYVSAVVLVELRITEQTYAYPVNLFCQSILHKFLLHFTCYGMVWRLVTQRLPSWLRASFHLLPAQALRMKFKCL